MDNPGRAEVKIRRFKGNLDATGRSWTTLDSAPSAPQPQGAGAIPVPPALRNPEFMGIAAPWLQRNVRALTLCDPYLTPPGSTPQFSACGPLMMDFLLLQRNLVACAQSIATWLSLSLSLGAMWGEGHIPFVCLDGRQFTLVL